MRHAQIAFAPNIMNLRKTTHKINRRARRELESTAVDAGIMHVQRWPSNWMLHKAELVRKNCSANAAHLCIPGDPETNGRSVAKIGRLHVSRFDLRIRG